ncbi:hypothetical protein [Microbacterium sp. P5_E9]
MASIFPGPDIVGSGIIGGAARAWLGRVRGGADARVDGLED